MASVSGSDSSSSSAPASSSRNDEIRKNREEYQQNESDMVKRHQREIKRLNEQHATEVESLKQEHNRQIAEIQKNSSKSLTEKDQRYQSEIDNIRSMHRKQLQSTADDQQKREETLKTAIASDRDEEKQRNDQRVQQLGDDYKRDVGEKDARLTEGMTRDREEQLRGLNEQREKIEKAHQVEMENSRKSANERIGQLQKDFGNYRRETVDQKQKSDVKHLEDTQRQGDNFVRTVAKERTERAEAEAKMQDANSEGLQGVRDGYRRNLDKKQADLDAARTEMEDDYHGHIAPELRRLTDDNEQLKVSNEKYDRKHDLSRAREMANFRDGYQKNIDNFRMQRDEAVRTGNDRRTKDINDLTEKNNRMNVETNRNFLIKQDDQDRRLKGEYRTITGDFKSRSDQLETLTDARVKNVISSTEDEKQRLYKLNQDNHEIMQRQQADTVKTVRVNSDAEKADAVERLKDQARQQEIGRADKMASASQKFQKDMATLQDQLLRERRSSDDTLRRTIDDMERGHKTSMDQQSAKYEERIRLLQNQQAEELRRVNRTNEERMNQIAALKKT